MYQLACTRRQRFALARFLPRPRGSRRWALFGTVGAVAFVVDMSVLGLGVYGFGLAPGHARLLSIPAATTLAWYLNRRLTFRRRGHAGPAREWLRYMTASTGNLAVNYFGYLALVSCTRVGAAHPLFSVLPGALAGLALNYWLVSRWVFVTSGCHRGVK